MKEQGRQYQATVYFKAGGTITRQFKSKKKAEQWAKKCENRQDYHIEVVK